MNVLLLTRIEKILNGSTSFLKNTEITLTFSQDILSFHNELARKHYDCFLLDLHMCSQIEMDIGKHIKTKKDIPPCYFINLKSTHSSSLELYNVNSPNRASCIRVSKDTFSSFLFSIIHEKPTNLLLFDESKLNKQQIVLLYFLYENKGKHVSITSMSEHLFGENTDQHKKTVYAYIHTLRLHIEENPKNPKHLIRTKKGIYTYV